MTGRLPKVGFHHVSIQFLRVGNWTKLIKDDGSGDVTYDYSYNGLGQLVSVAWIESGTDYEKAYSYDANGNLTPRDRPGVALPDGRDGSRSTTPGPSFLGSGWSTEKKWTFEWDVRDRLVAVEERDGSDVRQKRIEYDQCITCSGSMTDRIEYNESMVMQSWLRYEWEGPNLLRIDEMYDGEDAGTGLNQGDPFRPLNVFVHGPGSIGQIVRNQAYYNGNPSVAIYYFYDALGNVVTMASVAFMGEGMAESQILRVSDRNEVTITADAFGNRAPGSSSWPPITSGGPKEHLTGKMYDEDTGLYYFHARWYDPEVGRFVGRDPLIVTTPYVFCQNSPLFWADPRGLEEDFVQGPTSDYIPYPDWDSSMVLGRGPRDEDGNCQGGVYECYVSPQRGPGFGISFDLIDLMMKLKNFIQKGIVDAVADELKDKFPDVSFDINIASVRKAHINCPADTWCKENPNGRFCQGDKLYCSVNVETDIWEVTGLGISINPDVNIQHNFLRYVFESRPTVTRLMDNPLGFGIGLGQLNIYTGTCEVGNTCATTPRKAHYVPSW